MEQDLRVALKTGDTLYLTPVHGRGSAEKWEIQDFVGAGGSALCYRAKCSTKTGRLKEFYPADGNFIRQADGALRQNSPAAAALCGEFLRAYELLEQIKESDPSAELLNNFLPPYLLLHSGDGGTVYIWTPDDKQGITFEQYLRDAWKRPEKSPEHKLYNILDATVTVTDCARVLHRAGLLHLDIKPSNFLVLYDGDFNIDPGSISLFDINTLCPMGSASSMAAGSAGYCAPEVPRGKADNRSDLYSVGAMLFRAVTGRHYSRENYNQLDTILADSPLIRASRTNSNVFLRHTLGKILKKCLASRAAERYGSCEELLPDLKKARTFLLPEVAGDQLGWQKKLAILDTEPQENCSPAAVMHDLLYRDPPDTHLTPDEDTIRILVVGAGTYGQKFIDICLQACQLLDKKLHITALSQNPALDQEVYFQVRPALPEFLEQACGDILLEFKELTFTGEETAALDALLDAAPIHYVFVSLGDDRRSMDAAERLAKAAAKRGMTCGIHFAVQGMEVIGSGYGNPVYIHAPVGPKNLDPQLRRMAFHTHVSWAEGEKEDLKALRRQFRNKYNLEASLTYALCVGSKLRSVGIFEKDPQKAAERFTHEILEQPDGRFDRLVALEHRRWVLEKITSGWQLPRAKDGTIDLQSGIARGSMKDGAKKTHPCIVPSRADAPLKLYTKQQWDAPNDTDKGLDELDTLSVRQHRLCLEAAKTLRNSNPLRDGELALIRRRLEKAPEAVKWLFEEYAFCLAGILNGSYRAAKQLDRREADLRDSFAMLSAPVRRELTGRLRQVRIDFFPAVESCLYRDYKRQDEVLIQQIPYILTGVAACSDQRALTETAELPFAEEPGMYVPDPLDTSDICLPPQLLELTEQLAANIHDVWAENRIREGWTYGPERDDQTKTTPCLVPYEQLPESERAYDRDTALQTLKMITKLGWRIGQPEKA